MIDVVVLVNLQNRPRGVATFASGTTFEATFPDMAITRKT
jgi:hypothetical protein